VFHQVAVRVEQSKAVAVHEVLVGQISNQSGLTSPGFSDDVHVSTPVGALDPESLPLIAEVGLGKDGDWIVILLAWHA
jgi:hypothetical protein